MATMKEFRLEGMGVALVTPFHPDKSIDYDALGRLVEFQIAEGADFMVVLGTTSSSCRLSTSRASRQCSP